MRKLVSAATLLLALSACGGASDGGGDEPSAPAPSPTSTAEATGMLDACPTIESELPEMDASADEWASFIAVVDGLSAGADLETRNALELLLPGAESARKIAEEGGLPIEAEMNVTDSVQAFANRCEAAGSSALQ